MVIQKIRGDCRKFLRLLSSQFQDDWYGYVKALSASDNDTELYADVITAECGKTEAGYIVVQWTRFTADIHVVLTVPQFLRQGVASRLVRHIECIAKQKRRDLCAKATGRSLEFWRKLGFGFGKQLGDGCRRIRKSVREDSRSRRLRKAAALVRLPQSVQRVAAP